MEVYSVERAIQNFFDYIGSPSRQECDDFACSLLGSQSVTPFKIQGQFSYTVFSTPSFADAQTDKDESNQPTTNTKIVQFRLHKSKIDLYVAQLAKAVHGDIAAETDYCGEIGQDVRGCLSVYTIQKLPGVTYIEMEHFTIEMDSKQTSKQETLVEGFARYEKSILIPLLLYFQLNI